MSGMDADGRFATSDPVWEAGVEERAADESAADASGDLVEGAARAGGAGKYDSSRDTVGRGKARDPIVLLRDSTVEKRKVRFADDHLEFEVGQKSDGSGAKVIKINRQAKCGYRMSEKDVNMDIGSVWYMLRETSSDRPYTQELAKRRGFRYIGVQYRADLGEYLTGRSQSCPGLQVMEEAPRKRHRALSPEDRAKKKKKYCHRQCCEHPSRLCTFVARR